jgi:DNA modification methylase
VSNVKSLNGQPVRRVKVVDLIKAPYNPRTISEQQASALRKSIDTFGLVEPIIINDQTGNVVGGHQRIDALVASGVKETDVIVVNLDADNEKMLNVALNKVSGEWDDQKLRDLFNDIGGGELDLTLTGFEPTEIESLLGLFANEGLTDDDAIPEHVETVCKTGDIWQLGEHRLMCGDSTDAGSVALLMNGEKADMVFTDPPYGMNLDTDYSKLTTENTFGCGKKHRRVINDDKQFDARFLMDMSKDVVLFGADYYVDTLPNSGKDGSWMIWDKRLGDSQDKGFGSCFETIWCKQKHKRWMLRHEWFGFFTGGEKRAYEHPTTKPVGLLAEIFKKINAPFFILDLFLGSGTTLIACEKLNRKCYGMEIDEHYCDVIIKRWEDFTGKQAVKL